MGLPRALARIAEQPFGLGVDEHDLAGLVDDDHGIRRRFEQPAELGFRAAPLGEVTNGAADEDAFVGLQWTQADLHGKLIAVLLETVQLQALLPCRARAVRQTDEPFRRGWLKDCEPSGFADVHFSYENLKYSVRYHSNPLR